MLAAPRKFSWENTFIDLSMADHDTRAAAAAEAQEAAEAAAAAEAISGTIFMCCTLETCTSCVPERVYHCHLPQHSQALTVQLTCDCWSSRLTICTFNVCM